VLIAQVVFFFYSADAHTQTDKFTDATDHATHASATAVVGNDDRQKNNGNNEQVKQVDVMWT